MSSLSEERSTFARARDDGYELTDDPARVDVDAVHAYLSRSYWSTGVPRAIVARAIEHSLNVSLFKGADQVGFARVVTDRATYAYLCDVYVLEEHRGRGLGTWLMGALVEHPALQGLRRFALVTRDAHGLYAKFGFEPLASPERHMEVLRRGLYRS